MEQCTSGLFLLPLPLVFSPLASPRRIRPLRSTHFTGVVKSVDLTGKTITLKTGRKSFLFHVTDERKISGRDGGREPGQDPAWTERRGSDGTRRRRHRDRGEDMVLPGAHLGW